MDFDKTLREKVAQANNSSAGRVLDSVADRIGGVPHLAALNIICTAILGFVVTYPIYVVGGIIPALPTAIFTVILLILIGFSAVNHLLGFPFRGHVPRKLLTFGILFSLPFGLLSLPLLHSMSGEKRRKTSSFK